MSTIKPTRVSPFVGTTGAAAPTAPSTPAAVGGGVSGAVTPIGADFTAGAARPPAAASPQNAAPNGVPVDPQDMAIVCPVLGALVAEGNVKMNAAGEVKMSDLRHAFGDQLGFDVATAATAASLGLGGNKPADVLHNLIHQEFNVLNLRTGLAKHQGDSAILTGGKFDEQKFQALTSHAVNGVMTEDSFAAAIASNYTRDNHGSKLDAAKGKLLAFGEYGALLTTFGTRDPATGKLGLKVDDLREMFEHQRLPAHGGGHGAVGIARTTAEIGVKTDAQLASGAFRSTATVTGLAAAGARLAADQPEKASSQASVGAGKAASCPFLNGGAKMPGAEELPALHAGLK